jgi:hypothetical protein
MNPDGTLERQLAKLRKDLGEVFLAALADPDTVEIVLNADGTLWHERLGEPLQCIGTMSAPCGDSRASQYSGDWRNRRGKDHAFERNDPRANGPISE